MGGNDETAIRLESLRDERTNLFIRHRTYSKKEDQPFSDLTGIDEEHVLHTINFDQCAAVVCRVEEKDYGEKVLEEKRRTWNG